MKIQRIVYLLLFSLVINSCETKEDLSLGIGPAYLKGKLKSLIENNVEKSTSIKTEFAYNEAGLLKSIKKVDTGEPSNSEETFSYNDSNRVIKSILVSEIKGAKESFERTFTYDESNKVSQIKEVKLNSNITNYYFFDYSSDGNVVEFSKRQILNNSNLYKGGGQLAWKSKNVVVFNEQFDTGLIEETDFLYDGKRNPLNKVYSEILKIPSLDFKVFSINNITFYKRFFDGNKYKVENVYNNSDFLISQKVLRFTNNDYKEIGQNIFEYYL